MAYRPYVPGESPEQYLERLSQAIAADPGLAKIFTGARDVELKDNRHHIVPSAVTVTAGGTPVGAITTMQTFRDGIAYNLPEASGVPGIDFRVHFDNVSSFQQVSISAKYVGSTSHNVYVQLLEQPSGEYRTIYRLDHEATFGNDAADFFVRTVLTPNPSSFISTTQRVTMRFYHVATGNTGHDLWIDYLALVA